MYERIHVILDSEWVEDMPFQLSRLMDELAHNYKVDTGNLIGEEECRYCGGNCPNDEAHACDGYLGDIDNLYKEDV
jgi:hypothetical protein